MHPPLTAVELRVLGCLIEKEAATPDLYPLTPSALVAACNQTTNREPVMALGDDAVAEAAVALRRRGLVRSIQPAGSRVGKYDHQLAAALGLDARALAVLGVLMLRGPQTPGELHTRTARLARFDGIADVEATLDALIAREAGALAARLPRRPGQKEVRYAHLLGGDAGATDAGEEPMGDDRVASLERTVAALRAEVADLRAELREFRAQFG
ncbi:YceH family protein [Roseisolibacter sp. H3M3-2]|uniref:YceH family protein n=1 Tax=Roseisolibacter sp. H3M3-2 TaxID=3031323 RepID=UPI0023DC6F2C|nr:YceH family protein [Roseisolibacter sp. H3M3-2]MDF1503284.1 YceH family protein [Roseisolibacter sp. H3M3-2]